MPNYQPDSDDSAYNTGTYIDGQPGNPLSSREYQILGLAASGLLDKEIGPELGISLHTLHTYWKRIRAKVGEGNRSALVAAHVRSESEKLRHTNPAVDNDSESVSVYLAAELKRSQAAEMKAARAFRVVRSFSAALSSVIDEKGLFELTCKVLVESGGYPLAWVGIPVDDEAKSIRIVTQFPHDSEVLRNVKVSWGDNELGQGPSGRAIRSGHPEVNRDFYADPSVKPWVPIAKKAGFQSAVSLPVVIGDAVTAVLTTYAPEPDGFDDHELELLKEVTDGLTRHLVLIREVPLAGGEPASWEVDLRDWTLRSFDLAVSRRLGIELEEKCDLELALTLLHPEDGLRMRSVIEAARDSYVPSFTYKSRLAAASGLNTGGSYVEVVRDETGAAILLRARRVPILNLASAPFGDQAIGHYREELRTGEVSADDNWRSILRIAESQRDLRMTTYSRIKLNHSSLGEMIQEIVQDRGNRHIWTAQIEDADGNPHLVPAETRLIYDDAGPTAVEVTLLAYG